MRARGATAAAEGERESSERQRARARSAALAPQRGEQLFAIATTTLTATFDGRGLLSVSVSSIAPTVRIESDSFALALDGVVVNSSALAQPAASQPDAHSVQLDRKPSVRDVNNVMRFFKRKAKRMKRNDYRRENDKPC